MGGVGTIKLAFFLQKQLFAGLCLIAATLLLSACLPDGTSSTKEKNAEQAKIESTNVASSLTNIAMQVQSRIVSDDAVYAGIKANSWEINLGTLAFPAVGTEKVIYASAADVAQTKAFLCPLDGTETRFQQITWLDTRNAAGAFSMKGIGENSGPLLSALNARLSSDIVGAFKNGDVTMNNGNVITLPPGCGVASAIPNNSPVIVFTIDKPIPPAQDITRLEYKTIACESPSIGKQLQRRTFIIYAAGGNNSTTTEAQWVNAGDGCALAANISADAMTEVAGQAPQVNIGDLAGDAAADLRTTLVQQLATPCVTSKTTQTIAAPANTALASAADSDSEAPINESNVHNSQVDTCGAATSITVAPEPSENNAGAPRTETMSTVCSSAGLSNTGTGSYASFNGSTALANWSGDIVLDRLVRVSTNQALTQGDTTGAWRGRTLECSRSETLTIPCSEYLATAANARNTDRNGFEPKNFIIETDIPYRLTRTNSVSGFADANALLPNTPANPAWAPQSGSCQWRETETIVPSCDIPNEFMNLGERHRTITVGVDGTVTQGDWQVPIPASCAAGRDEWRYFDVQTDTPVGQPIGSCAAPGRNQGCTLSFNLFDLIVQNADFRNELSEPGAPLVTQEDLLNLSQVSVRWFSTTMWSETIFNAKPEANVARDAVTTTHRGFRKIRGTVEPVAAGEYRSPEFRDGGGKFYATDLIYNGNNRNVTLNARSGGWGKCKDCSGSINRIGSARPPVRIGYYVRVRASSASAGPAITEGSEEVPSTACPAGTTMVTAGTKIQRFQIVNGVRGANIGDPVGDEPVCQSLVVVGYAFCTPTYISGSPTCGSSPTDPLWSWVPCPAGTTTGAAIEWATYEDGSPYVPASPIRYNCMGNQVYNDPQTQ